MAKNVIVLEDSSKVGFGGGQKITMYAINALLPRYQIFLADCVRHSKLLEMLEGQPVTTILLKCFGKHANKPRGSLNVFWLEFLLTPFFLLFNLIFMLYYFRTHRIFSNETLLYVTTKKGLLLAYLLHFFNFRYIFHAHSLDNPRFIFPMLKKAETVICVSHIVQKNIALPNCKVVYNPITPQLCQRQKHPKQPIVVAVFASLVRLKGIHVFIESHSHLSSNNVEYRIYGVGPELKNLIAYESEWIKFMGFCNTPEKEMCSQIDIVVVPSIIEESFSLVSIEAFAAGIPVIATDIGGQAEIVKNGTTGLHVETNNAKQIAEKIDLLINDPDLYAYLSNNAKEYAKEFDFIHFKTRLSAIFEKAKLRR